VLDSLVSSFPIAALRDHAVGSKALVSAVAEGRFPRALALTERHLSLLFDEELNGDEVRALVGAVTVWLVLGAAAGAPVIGTRFQFQDCRKLRGTLRSTHDIHLLCCRVIT
jgi:hypothetical protein